MKLKQFALLAGATLAILFIGTNKSQAITLLLQKASPATPAPGDFVLNKCADLGLCVPSDIFNLTYAANITDESVLIKNDSDFDSTGFIYTILPGQDAQWDPASKFDSFSNVEISPDGKILTISGGVVAVGETTLFGASNPGNSAVNLTVRVEGRRAIPESTSVLGVVAFAALSATSVLKKNTIV